MDSGTQDYKFYREGLKISLLLLFDVCITHYITNIDVGI
jgi:hypothetical protein